MPILTAWMDLENIMLSEIKSVRKAFYDFIYGWNLKKITKRPDTEMRWLTARGGCGRWRDWVKVVGKQKLPVTR